MSFFPLLAAAQPGANQGDGMMSMLIMFGGVILVFYFMIIRPQKKRQKEFQSKLESLKKGDSVVMSNGIHGKITDIEDTTATVQIADNVKVKVEKYSLTTMDTAGRQQ